MIVGWKNKRFQRLHEKGETSSINREHISKLKRIAAALEVATTPMSMSLPGFKLHELKPSGSGIWAVWVSANYRVTFVFVGNKKDVDQVDYVDYH